MTWLKIDDQSTFHPKVMKAGNEAWGAVCRAGAWSANHGTDGQIPWEIALRIGSKPVWNRAEKSGLIEQVTSEGFAIHDFLHWNPSADAVRLERARKAKNIADLRARRRSQQTNGVTTRVTGDIAKVLPVTYRGPDPDPDPDLEEAEPSAAPPTPKPGTSSTLPHEAEQIRDRIRSHPELASLDAHRMAEIQFGWMMAKPQLRLVWVLDAIDECVAKAPPGMVVGKLQSMLVGFMRNAKAPRVDAAERKPATTVAQSADIPADRAEMLRKAQAEKRAKADAARAHAQATHANGGKHA